MKIRPSVILAVLLAVGAVGWIASGQMPSDTDTAVSDIAEGNGGNAQLAARGETSEEAAAPKKKAITVRVRRSEAVAHRAIMVMTGRTHADRRVTVSAETDGRVQTLSVGKSDTVEEGQELARIAANERYAALNEAEALVKQREIEADAARKLAEKGFQSTTKRAEADAKLSAAKAQFERVRVDLAKTTVEAPFAASVERKAIEAGDFVQRGDPILHLVDLDPLVVSVHVSERDISSVRVGAKADIRLVSGEKVEGVVSNVATTADDQTRTFEVELEVANPDRRLRDGVTAQVRLPAREVTAHRISPAWLTLDDEGRVGVKTVASDRTVRFAPVEIVEDLVGGMYVAGLEETVDIITVGQGFVKDGTRVSVAYDRAPGTPDDPLGAEDKADTPEPENALPEREGEDGLMEEVRPGSVDMSMEDRS